MHLTHTALSSHGPPRLDGLVQLGTSLGVPRQIIDIFLTGESYESASDLERVSNSLSGCLFGILKI